MSRFFAREKTDRLCDSLGLGKGLGIHAPDDKGGEGERQHDQRLADERHALLEPGVAAENRAAEDEPAVVKRAPDEL